MAEKQIVPTKKPSALKMLHRRIFRNPKIRARWRIRTRGIADSIPYFYPWVCAMWKHGKVWLALCFSSWVLYFFERYLHHPIPMWSMVMLAVIGIAWSSFLAWKDQRHLTERRDAELDIANEKLRNRPLTGIEKLDAIDAFVRDADKLINAIRSSQTPKLIGDAKDLFLRIEEFGKRNLNIAMHGVIRNELFSFSDAAEFFPPFSPVVDPYSDPVDKGTIETLVKKMRALRKIRKMIED